MAAPAISADAYQLLSDIEHVLLRSDMYLGPIDRVIRLAKCLNQATNEIQQKQVHHSEGQEQTFKEIIGNAADNVLRSRKMGVDPRQIEIMVTPEWVIVKNYGIHITVAVNNQTGKWVPDMIFGNMRAGSNFNDSEERMYIGKNGIGAKATNIFSKVFMIECADPVNGLLYKQVWRNNMSIRGEPEITQLPPGTPGYTQVSYSLDFARFTVASFDQEALEIYGAHAAALSYVCQIPVYFNGNLFQVQNLVDYAGMFFPVTKASSILYRDPNGAYDLCLIDTPDAGISVSFVNGMITENGGAHVDAAYKVVVSSIINLMGKEIEGVKLTKRDIVNHVSVFISCRVSKPIFKSQVKDCLVRPEPKVELPEKLLQGIKRWKLFGLIASEIERKQNNKLSKEVGGKKKRGYWGKAQPANLAGTNQSDQCTYILTEGDSADSYRLKFISQVPNGMGRQYYGSQPLRGKLPNALNADFAKIFKNEELKAIRKNIGLRPDTDYRDPANYRKLNYGRVLIFPDPDNDGKHILGLILLFFLTKFPSLIMRGYLSFLRIPVVRARIGGQRCMFYSMSSFKRTIANLPPGTPVTDVEYFKGLGSSEDHHIKEDFANPRIVTFKMDEETIASMLLAFHKTQTHLRKQWIADWVDREMIEVETYSELPISIFINYELIDYSIENIARAIPEAIDGMKESQRKFMYGALKKLRGKGKKAKAKMKVAQIASHASELTNYKHGDTCLADTGVMMAQEFPASNNLPLLEGRGQFGTRNKGGKDAANPRYTCVSLPYWTSLVFRQEDQRLERRIEDEGQKQECENFFPTLPLHVINGERGIGSAYSTNIPAHKPTDVAFWFQERLLMDLDPDGGHHLPMIRPWYKGFTGEINLRPNGFTTEGRLQQQADGSWLIDELPIGTWTYDYEEFLRELEEENIITGFDTFSTDTEVRFVIYKYNDGTPTLRKLKLISKHSFKNMTVLYRTADRGVKPRIYSDIHELLEDFYKLRLVKYQERKALIIAEIEAEIADLTERARYIHLVAVTKELEVRDRPEEDILADMARLNLDPKWLDKVKDREKNKNRIPILYTKIQEKMAEKQQLEQIRPEVMWYQDIEQFVVAFCQHEKCQRSTHETVNPVMTINLGSH